MKRAKNLILLIVITLLFSACEKEKEDDIVKPITLYSKLAGTWHLQSLVQTDEIAKAYSYEFYEMDLTHLFNYSNVLIIFTLDEEDEPTSFKLDGDAPALFLDRGFWDLDNPFPTTNGNNAIIRLYDDESKTELIDELEMITPPGSESLLELKLTRSSSGTEYVSYTYKMKPII